MRAVALLLAGVVLAVAAPSLAAPEKRIRLTGIAGTDPVTGKFVSLAHYRGRPVVINAWASWCAGCNEEATALATLARRHPDVPLVGIDYMDSKSAARAFYRRWKWKHPSIFDPSGKLTFKLKAPGLPATVFLNRRHEIVTVILGAGTLAQFEAGVKKIR